MKSTLSAVLIVLGAFLLPAAPALSQWQYDGVAFCTATGTQSSPTIVSDGSGGAIVTWNDARSGNFDIYAQRVDSAGAAQWTADGVAVCTVAQEQSFPTIVSDGSGGAIITWHDARSGTSDIYAQRVDSAGTAQWTANGAAICTATGNQIYPTIVTDGSGGAIITWFDSRSGNTDIYSQRVNSAGVAQWQYDGVAVCTATEGQNYPTIVSAGSGEAIIT